MIYKSFLFTCALDNHNFIKAKNLDSDVMVLDLEDSISNDKKHLGRNNVCNFYEELAKEKITAIRINAMSTTEIEEDLKLLNRIKNKPDIIILPKIESAQEIEILKEQLKFKKKIKIFPIIETCKGISRIESIAEKSDGIILGAADLASEIGINIDSDIFNYVRSRIILISTANKIPIIESPCFEIRDLNKTKLEAEKAMKMGFTGMVCLNPNQVEVVNKTFYPSAHEIELAKKIVDSYDNHDKFAIINGQVIAPPFFKKSLNLLKKL